MNAERGGTPRLPKGLRYRSGLRSARPNRFTMATHECFLYLGGPQPPKKGFPDNVPNGRGSVVRSMAKR